MKHSLVLTLVITTLLSGYPLYGQLSKLSRAASSIESSLARRIAQLERENAILAAENMRERTYQTELFDKAKLATFRAVPSAEFVINSYTGTVFEVANEGEKEIFGVVATHALQDPFETPGMLDREFKAIVVRNNEPKILSARVVQLSSCAMGDVALVKFDPKDEPLFEPLALADTELSFPARGYAQGYACNLLAKQTFPLVGETSIGLLKSKLPAVARGQRAGFCGSPVFTTDFKFVGVHVGSSYKTNDGFITPVRTLKGLVEAFHSAKATPYSIKLNGKEIARLAADEYVISMEFLDAAKNLLWRYHTNVKFSLIPAQTKLHNDTNVAFIVLNIGKTHWKTNAAQGEYLVNDAVSHRTLMIPWD